MNIAGSTQSVLRRPSSPTLQKERQGQKLNLFKEVITGDVAGQLFSFLTNSDKANLALTDAASRRDVVKERFVSNHYSSCPINFSNQPDQPSINFQDFFQFDFDCIQTQRTELREASPNSAAVTAYVATIDAAYANPVNRQDAYRTFDDKGREEIKKEHGISNLFLLSCIAKKIITIKEASNMPENVRKAPFTKSLNLLKANKNVLAFVARLLIDKVISYEAILNLNKRQIKILEKPHIQNFIKTNKLTFAEAITKKTAFEILKITNPIVPAILRYLLVNFAYMTFFADIIVFFRVLPNSWSILLTNRFNWLVVKLREISTRNSCDRLSGPYLINIPRYRANWKFKIIIILNAFFSLAFSIINIAFSPLRFLWRLLRCFFFVDALQYPANRRGLELQGVKKYVDQDRLIISRDLINNPRSWPQNLDLPIIQDLIDDGQITIQRALDMPPMFAKLLAWFF